MADFHQTGIVTGLHQLKTNNIAPPEADPKKFSRAWPGGLVLPALYDGFETLAMGHIVAELKQVKYLQRIAVAPGQATE